MKKSVIGSVLLFIGIILMMSGCKKEKAVEVYFTTSSATGSKGDPASIATLEFSEPTKDVVEFDFNSNGVDPIRFGTYNSAFSHDDSEKCQVTIDNYAFIDSAGHVKIGYGVKKVTISFTPKVNNFPHASASYKIQIANAKNATIRSGNDVFSYNIGSSETDNKFSSTLLYAGVEQVDASNTTQRAGQFNLNSSEFVKNSSGKYDLTLQYAKFDGNQLSTTLELKYSNLDKPQVDNNTYNCSNSSLSARFTTPDATGLGTVTQNIDCSAFTQNDFNLFLWKRESGIYGTYYVFTGNVVIKVGNTYSFVGELSSPFILFE